MGQTYGRVNRCIDGEEGVCCRVRGKVLREGAIVHGCRFTGTFRKSRGKGNGCSQKGLPDRNVERKEKFPAKKGNVVSVAGWKRDDGLNL